VSDFSLYYKANADGRVDLLVARKQTAPNDQGVDQEMNLLMQERLEMRLSI